LYQIWIADVPHTELRLTREGWRLEHKASNGDRVYHHEELGTLKYFADADEWYRLEERPEPV
jgi:hypothetical protein